MSHDAVNPNARWALFLDVDGTLIELAETPESVYVPPELKSLLHEVTARLEGALALVSGRTIANIDELSLSGQQAGPHAALWLTQWKHLARPDGPHYGGSVL